MNVALLIGKISCMAHRKHKHGKRISTVPYQDAPGYNFVRYQCPRCESVWSRKVKAQ